MTKSHRNSFAVAVLTALGVLPVPAESTATAHRDTALSHLNPIDLERATIVAALKETPAQIRSGRLGH